MAQLNKRTPAVHTHEGATAKHINAEQQLRRSVMSCMLWEDGFYESGVKISDRITALIAQVESKTVAKIAIDAREKMKLRHVPLLIVREMARNPIHRPFVAQTLAAVIQRPDELTEFVSLYWKDKKQPLSAQVKKGLAKAFTKFNEYSLAKYNRDKAVKLRDVLFLCHAKPLDAAQEATWKKLVDNTLPTPDTWETTLSSGADKRDAWTRLLRENKLGALALLRNLRNMGEASVDRELIKDSIRLMKTERVLPFRFIAAARFAPDFEPQLEAAMFSCLEEVPKLSGKTCILVDVSGSMDEKISSKSDLTRLDAASGLAMLLREVSENLTVRTFSNALAHVPLRRGFALRDAIVTSQAHGGTDLGGAVKLLQAKEPDFDRLIIITDEQSQSKVPDPTWKHPYVINVASNEHGIGYGKWNHIDGWSEAIVDFINEYEKGVSNER